MRCPSCGRENPSEARFCNACGASLHGEPPTSLASLQRYLPKDLADKLRALGGQLPSERRPVTVVFADISGFTALSEKLDPEEVTQLINACFKTLVEVIFQYEGTIDKFIGDEIMALFGAPLAHENDPERAIRAALEMQQCLRQFNESLTISLPQPLTLHVGINSGEVIAGNVGSDLRMDYSVLGDTVNLAARLEGASPAGQILVSERTYSLTRHVFEFRRLKLFKVQGKQRKVPAYQVLGVKALPERGRGVSEGYGPLVGRQAEVVQLREVVEAVQSGQGRVLGVVGEAGIGKSRLVYELGQLASTFTQASAACVSYEVPASYQVFTDLLRSLLSLAPDDPEEVLRRKLEAWVVAHEVDRETHLPYLGSLLGLRDEQLLYLSDPARLQGVKAALLAVFQALTAARPLLLVFEDLHWVDPRSHRLLEALVPEVGSLPLLLCGVYRPEFQPAWKDPCQILAVGPLSPEQTVELSQTLLNLDLPPELEQLIVSRAEGNPFFAEEMLKALIDEGAILKTRSGYALKQDLSQLRLPDTMQGVILARLDRLEAQARDTLQYAAVIGRRFPQALLQAVPPRAQQVEQDLQQLQSLELVYRHRILPDLEYIFKHFVIREVAYHNLLLKRRKALHLEIARSIEQLYRDRLEDYYEALAHHFELGEDWQKAADYIRGRREFILIPFQAITSIEWQRRMGWRDYFRHPYTPLLGLPFHGKERALFGTSRFRTHFGNFYFGIASALRIATRDHLPLVLHSLDSGELYRALKLAMTKWATAQQADIAGVFKGSPSRFEEQYHLPVRHQDGTLLPPTTYDSLIESIEKGKVGPDDEVALREEEAKETWVPVHRAGKEDPRLWAALHPMWHSLKACIRNPIGMLLISFWVLGIAAYVLFLKTAVFDSEVNDFAEVKRRYSAAGGPGRRTLRVASGSDFTGRVPGYHPG